MRGRGLGNWGRLLTAGWMLGMLWVLDQDDHGHLRWHRAPMDEVYDYDAHMHGPPAIARAEVPRANVETKPPKPAGNLCVQSADETGGTMVLIPCPQ